MTIDSNNNKSTLQGDDINMKQITNITHIYRPIFNEILTLDPSKLSAHNTTVTLLGDLT